MGSQSDMIAPIRDEMSHKAALGEIDRLWGAAAGPPQGDRLDVLMTLVDAYERLRWPDDDVHPIDAIKARMENSDRTRKDFEKIVGSSGRASEILNRRRHLTLTMIWKLVRQWGIPADLLVKPYGLARPMRGPRRPRPRKKISRALVPKRRAAAHDKDRAFGTDARRGRRAFSNLIIASIIASWIAGHCSSGSRYPPISMTCATRQCRIPSC